MIYKFKGSESCKDLCDLEDKGIIRYQDQIIMFTHQDIKNI
jgi:hypothetical protein